jgi:O-antigen/teichoic acid export membrane protein
MSDPRDAYFDVSDVTTDIGRQTGRSASVIMLFSLLRLAITLVSTAILARLVPPDQQGQVAMVLPVVLIAAGLSEFGLPQAVIQRPQISHRVVSALFWVNIGLGITLTIGAAALAPVAVWFYAAPEVLWILLALAPYILITVTTVHYVAILRRRMQIRTAEICSFAGVLVGSICAGIAALLGAGAWALVVQMLVAQSVSLACFMIAVRWRPSTPWRSDFSQARGALAFGGYLSLERLLNEVVMSLQTIVIGRAFGTVAAGLYFRSNIFADMPRRRFVDPLSGAFVPSLSRLQDDPSAFRDMYIRQISRGNLVMIPVGLMICLAPDVIVTILLGPTWLLAVPILGWLGSRPLMALFDSANTWVMVATGKPKALFQARCVSSVFMVAVLVFAAQFDIVTFVALFVIAQAIVTFLFMPLVIMRHTPITLATIRTVITGDIVFCLLVGAAGVLLRQVIEFAPIIEGIAVGVVICTAQGIRIGMTPRYRRDVLRLFAPKG